MKTIPSRIPTCRNLVLVLLFSLASICQSARATGTYRVDSIIYNPYSFSGGATAVTQDDVWGAAINIGFNFTFYGNTYSRIIVGSNGQICFDTTRANSYDQWQLISVSGGLPTTAVPTNTINAAYRDIDVNCGGQITYAVYGTAPHRYLVVSWDTVPLYGGNNASGTNCNLGGTAQCTALPSTFQAVLYEGCNSIDIYIANSISCTGWNGGLGIIGLQDSAGTNGIAAPGRNNTTWTAYQEAWRFTDTSGSCAPLRAVANTRNELWCLPNDTSASITVIPIGGYPPYQYALSGGTYQSSDVFTHLLPGMYTVSVIDSMNATYSLRDTITRPLGWNVTATAVPSTIGRSDGSITINISGGVLPYTFQVTHFPGYNNTQGTGVFSGLSAGLYNVNIVDSLHQCDTTLYIRVDSIAPSGGPAQTICMYNTTYMAATGTGTWTALASNPSAAYVVTPSSRTTEVSGFQIAGLYRFVWVTGRGSDTVDITVNPVTLISNGPSLMTCQNDTVTLIAPIPGSWSAAPWNLSTTQISVSNADTTTVSGFTVPGIYLYLLTNSYGCSDTVFVNIVAAPLLAMTATDVSCYGNINGGDCVAASGGSGYTYLWSGGQTTRCINNLTAGAYALTVTDTASGCSTANINFVNSPTALNVLIDSIFPAVCGNNGAIIISALGGTPPYSYMWNTNPIQTTGSATSLIAGVYCVTVTDSNACLALLCDSVGSLPCPPDSIWPGDADNNQLVDNNDLLPIGLAYDTTGPVRTVQGIVWQADAATPWAYGLTSYTPAVNYDHADCNGDGIINADDTLAVSDNFGLIHAKSNPSQGPWRSGTPVLYAIASRDSLHNGDTLTVTFSLGDQQINVTNFYAIAFTYNFDPLVVDSAYTSMTYGNSWIGTSTDKISLSKILSASGQIKTAVTRIDHTNRSGEGTIGTARFRINTSAISGQHQYTNIGYISDVKAITRTGQSIFLNDGADTTIINAYPLGINDVVVENIRVLPNPARDRVSISADHLIQDIAVTNVIGQNITAVTGITAKSITLDISSWSNGVYIIQTRTETGMSIVKLVVER